MGDLPKRHVRSADDLQSLAEAESSRGAAGAPASSIQATCSSLAGNESECVEARTNTAEPQQMKPSTKHACFTGPRLLPNVASRQKASWLSWACGVERTGRTQCLVEMGRSTSKPQTASGLRVACSENHSLQGTIAGDPVRQDSWEATASLSFGFR